MSGRAATCSTAAADDVGLAGRAGDEEVEVADGLAAAAEGAGGGDLVDAGKFADEVGDAVGVVSRLVDAEAAGVFAVVFDALEELGDEFFAHARQLGEMTGLGGGFERVDVGDLAGGPDEGYGLGAHAREAQEFEHGGFVFLQQLFAERHGAGGEDAPGCWRPCPCRCRGWRGVLWGRRPSAASWVVCCSTASAARR